MTDEEEQFVSVLVDATLAELRRRATQTGAVTVVTANAPNTTPLAACVTKRGETRMRGQDQPLDGGPVASVATG